MNYEIEILGFLGFLNETRSFPDVLVVTLMTLPSILEIPFLDLSLSKSRQRAAFD